MVTHPLSETQRRDSDDDYNEEASEYDDDYNYYEEEEESCHEPPSRRQRVIRSTRRAETVESEDEPDEPVTISRLIVKGVKRTYDTRFRIPKLCEDGYVRKIKSTPSKPILMLADSGADEHCVQPQTFYVTSRNSVHDDHLKSSYSEREGTHFQYPAKVS